MAVIAPVSCPKCEKKFKPKGDVQGKKIKCPFCEKPFVVPAAKAVKKPADAKDTRIKADKAKPEAPPPAPPPPSAAAKKASIEEELEASADPYGVKNQDLKARCPHCAKEMADEHAVICLHCGYNTLTRERGKTTKIFGLTTERHLKYLLPPVGAFIFCIFAIIGMIWHAVMTPYFVDGSWMSFLDSEALRLWPAIILLGILWASGVYCFKMMIERPKPDDMLMD